MTVRVVLADDHPMYRSGLGAILGQADSVEVVASASTGKELVRVAAELRPDVVITDL
jgi:DNA-binding NarL/FixJ family response regulator